MYKVLLADDEMWVLESLKRIGVWTTYGFEVVGQAENGPEAMVRIRALRPDLVLTDIRMPGCSGLELMAAFPESDWHPLFAVISGHAEFAYAQKAMLQGAIGYCVKPVDSAEIGSLLDKARRLLDSEAASHSEQDPGKEAKRAVQREDPARGTEGTAPREQTPVRGSRDAGAASPGGRISGNRIIPEALQYIEAHYMEPISIPELAGRYFLNPNYFCNLFKKEAGVPFTEHLAKVRIGHAVRLLTEGDLSVTEIASVCGYDNYFYFTRIFRRQTGKTPSQIRAERNMG